MFMGRSCWNTRAGAFLRSIPPPNASPRCAIPIAVRCGWRSCIRLPVGLFPICCTDFGVQRRGSSSPLSQAAAYEMMEFPAGGHVDLAITAPGLTEPGLDGTSCRSRACASWFGAITALPSAPDCASPKPPMNRSSHWVRNSQRVQVSTLKALEGDPNWVASVEELIDYDRTEHVPTRIRARPDGSDTERMEVCQPVSEASPASW